MSGQITRRLKPEEEDFLRKRDELASIRSTLDLRADRGGAASGAGMKSSPRRSERERSECREPTECRPYEGQDPVIAGISEVSCLDSDLWLDQHIRRPESHGLDRRPL